MLFNPSSQQHDGKAVECQCLADGGGDGKNSEREGIATSRVSRWRAVSRSNDLHCRVHRGEEEFLG
jgi:hypothetical protein